jgi:uncharacterized membrane protein YkvA (DUF1232 family)
LGALASWLPTWQVWPANVLAGLNYVISTFATLNFLIPVDTILNCFIFFIGFTSVFLIVKLILKVFNRQ